MSRYRIYTVIFWCFVLTSLFFRLIALRTTPAYFSHDEVHYITEARSVALAAQDLSGSWRPWHLRPSNPLYAELPSSIMALGSWFSSDPFVQARIVSVLMGIVLPLILGGIGWSLTGKRGVFYMTAVLGLLNPWLFQFSRLSFDAIYSIFFYSAGVLGLLTLPKKWRAVSFLAFALGFFQYQGLKLIFLPLLFVTVGYLIWREGGFVVKKDLWSSVKKQLPTLVKSQADLFMVLAASVLLFGWYVSVLSSQTAGVRVGDLIFFNDEFLATRVNEYRRVALASPLDQVFANKPMVIIQEFLVRYVEGFSPKQLFIQGESVRNPFAVWTRGFFHQIDVLLMSLGALALMLKKDWRKAGMIILAFALIAPLPSAVNSGDLWIMFRGAWIVVVGLLLMGVGTWFAIDQLPRVVIVGIIGIYLLSLASFGYEYFVRYPIYSTKGTAFGERVMANYIARLPEDKEVLVLVDEALFVYEAYLAYNGLITRDNLPEIQASVRSGVYHLGSVRFATDCLDTSTIGPNTVVINNSSNVTCGGEPAQLGEFPYAKIVSPIDNGALFTVLNDPVCSKYALQPYIHITEREWLDVEQLSEQQFCDKLLSKPVE